MLPVPGAGTGGGGMLVVETIARIRREFFAGSAQRLRKLAETIAALTRNAKRRRDSIMATAIEHWEQDLEFLYYEFYVEKFYFGWPTTDLG